MTLFASSVDVATLVRRPVWRRFYDSMIEFRTRKAEEEIDRSVEQHRLSSHSELLIGYERRRP